MVDVDGLAINLSLCCFEEGPLRWFKVRMDNSVASEKPVNLLWRSGHGAAKRLIGSTLLDARNRMYLYSDRILHCVIR